MTGPGFGAEVGRGEALPEAGTIDQPRLQARPSSPGGDAPGALVGSDTKTFQESLLTRTKRSLRNPPAGQGPKGSRCQDPTSSWDVYGGPSP